MKNIGFIADFYFDELSNGAESNDHNLINFLAIHNDVHCFRSSSVTEAKLEPMDCVIISNFTHLSYKLRQYLIENKKYIIYEHDHKYVRTRDPAEFKDFNIPPEKIINKNFYEKAHCVVVLSQICKNIIQKNMKNVNVKNIGCSLWSDEKFELLHQLSGSDKNGKVCLMKSENPTKNYYTAVAYCNKNNIEYETLSEQGHDDFLKSLSKYDTLVFIPRVLETFSRLCAEAKMLNLKILTNKKLIGFFSEDCSSLDGIELIEELKKRNKNALNLFEELL